MLTGRFSVVRLYCRRTYRDELQWRFVDPRTQKRRERIAIATHLAGLVNEPRGKQSKNARRIAAEKPQLNSELDENGVLRPKGYTRSTISTLRPYGRATLYWHAKSRSFRVKVDASVKGESKRRLLLDQFVRVSGMVGRCACGGCGLFFAKADPRMKLLLERQLREAERAHIVQIVRDSPTMPYYSLTHEGRRWAHGRLATEKLRRMAERMRR